MGFEGITYEDAIRQHPQDVMANFRRLSRKHHPDKHTTDKETKDKQTAIMRKILIAREMILVEDVLPNGLPKPGTTAQQMREYHAEKFLTDPTVPKAEKMRRHTKQSFTVGRAMIFAGKKMAHAALAAAFGQIGRAS